MISETSWWTMSREPLRVQWHTYVFSLLFLLVPPIYSVGCTEHHNLRNLSGCVDCPFSPLRTLHRSIDVICPAETRCDIEDEPVFPHAGSASALSPPLSPAGTPHPQRRQYWSIKRNKRIFISLRANIKSHYGWGTGESSVGMGFHRTTNAIRRGGCSLILLFFR